MNKKSFKETWKAMQNRKLTKKDWILSGIVCIIVFTFILTLFNKNDIDIQDTENESAKSKCLDDLNDGQNNTDTDMRGNCILTFEMIASTHYKNKEYKKAIRLLDRVIDHYAMPSDYLVFAYSIRGTSKRELGQHEESQKDLEKSKVLLIEDYRNECQNLTDISDENAKMTCDTFSQLKADYENKKERNQR